MKPIITILACVALACAPFIAGCNGDNDGMPSTPGAPETGVKSMDEYREQASKDITAENAAKELDKLEKEVDSEPVE